MRTKRSITALLFTVAICGCVTNEQQCPTLLPNQKGHRESGVAFPSTIGEFPRGEVKQYDAAGQNVSAAYDLIDSQNPVAITVYICLGPKLLSIGSPPDVIATARKHLTDGYFDEVKRQILKYHPNASAVSDEESSMMFRGQSLYGRTGTYKAKELFAHRIQSIVSSAEVYAYGEWIIKFRATYPEATEKAGAEATRAFIRDFMQQNERAPAPSGSARTQRWDKPHVRTFGSAAEGEGPFACVSCLVFSKTRPGVSAKPGSSRTVARPTLISVAAFHDALASCPTFTQGT